MAYIAIDKLKTGMALCEDVKDVNGRLLLPEGKIIEAQHLRILKMWGVTEVAIQGDHEENNSSFTADSEQLERAKNEAIPIFSHLDMKHPAMRELFRQAVLFRSRQPAAGNQPPVELAPDDDKPCSQLSDWRKHLSRKNIKLPASPGIVVELNEVMSNPYALAEDISGVVQKSPSLAATLLKIVNSAFYGFPSRIDSISRAVTLIGTREIKNLALGISVMNAFNDISNNFLDMNAFITHSLACGIISRILAAQKNISQTEQMFVSGLLHDLGKLIVFKYFPEHAAHMFRQSVQCRTATFDQERKYLGTRHTRIGAYLLEKWKLPVAIVSNVQYHHNPNAAPNFVQTAIIHTADIIVTALGIGSSGETRIAGFDQDAWKRLDLSPTCFERVINQATHQLSIFDSVIKA